MSEMDPMDLPLQTRRDVMDAVHAAMDQRAAHTDHHHYIDVLIRRQQRRIELMEKIKQQVFGWTVIALLGAIGTAVYYYLIHLVRTGGPK